MNEPVCNVCYSKDLELVYNDARDYITGDSFQVWQCNCCKAGITRPLPGDLSPYYPAKYRRYNRITGDILKFLYRQRVKKWSSRFFTPGVAFEMGCGNGLMLDTLRGLGWKVIGSERTIQSAHLPRHSLGLPMFVGGLESIHPSPHFDLIFLFQVLEHLHDPVKTVQQLLPFLKPNGKLIIGVPNFSSWQAKFGQEKWFHLDVPRHLIHYSPSVLETLFKESGMEIESVSYISWEHDPYGWVQTILNRLDRRSNRLTRLLMQIDPPGGKNLLHLALGAILGFVAVPLALMSWLLHRGALIEVTIKPVKRS